MKKFKMIFKSGGYKIKYWYYRIILHVKYNRKPNKDGTFDLMPVPGCKNAVLKMDE